jgi:hypothetical protein
MPYGIVRVSNGDLIVFGSNDQMDHRAWATRFAPDGEVRWDFLESGDRPQRFYGVVELPDQTIVLCGSKTTTGNARIVLLVTLDKDGKLLSEKIVPPVREHSVISLSSCHRRSDGVLLVGSASGQPAGTGWIAKLDLDLNLQWKKFSDDFGNGEFIDAGDTLIALGWHDQDFYLVKIGPSGDIINKHLLPEGEHHLVKGGASTLPLRVVTMLSNSQTEIWDFDDRLRGPSNTLRLHNVGVKAGLGLSDGSIAIIGAANTSLLSTFPSAGVTRVGRDGRYKTFLVEPLHQSPWYIDAVLTGNGKEIAAVRQLGVEQGVVDFLSSQ